MYWVFCLGLDVLGTVSLGYTLMFRYRASMFLIIELWTENHHDSVGYLIILYALQALLIFTQFVMDNKDVKRVMKMMNILMAGPTLSYTVYEVCMHMHMIGKTLKIVVLFGVVAICAVGVVWFGGKCKVKKKISV